MDLERVRWIGRRAPAARIVLQLAVAAGLLLVGSFVYFLDRSPEVVPVSKWLVWLLPVDGQTSLGILSPSMPTLVHTTALILLLNLAAPGVPIGLLCVSWCGLEVFSELMQAEFVPLRLPGTFDMLDVLAAIAGALLAYFFLRWNLRDAASG